MTSVRDASAEGGAALDPAYNCPSYRSTRLRHPHAPLMVLPAGLTERRGPVFGVERVADGDADLTRGYGADPLGERVGVSGRIIDSTGRPIRHQLVEIWQANAAGRYHHDVDRHPAPLDPNFSGAGRCLTDDQGRYRFVSIKPGAYPWKNHANAWRPAHIHFSVFGSCFVERLVTQMYFPGDPLLDYDPMYQSIRDRRAAQRLIAHFDLETTVENWALGYVFDIVIGPSAPTPVEPGPRP